ncbi:hypothetical protein AB0K18_16735 [Nonomuraea sp. NPDC049421]|uniref:hypothetical protein n=1 Tax=Nonomuraea sp. NPDC049421 TaxID=3155275 RepID=UPI00343D531C
MARRSWFKGQDPSQVVLGCALTVTITFIGSAITEYIVEGPEGLTMAYLAARGLILLITWVIALVIIGCLARRQR